MRHLTIRDFCIAVHLRVAVDRRRVQRRQPLARAAPRLDASCDITNLFISLLEVQQLFMFRGVSIPCASSRATASACDTTPSWGFSRVSTGSLETASE
jgi:hypothetical protein